MSKLSDGSEAPTPSLRVIEIFGPTVQGEGASVGRASYFLRLGGCNLTCEWCDTPYSWDPARLDPERPEAEATIDGVVERLTLTTVAAGEAVARHLVITGGEPLLQRESLTFLCARLQKDGWTIEVETSGTIPPGQLVQLVDQFNVSPKLAHSGVDKRARIRMTVLNEFAENRRAVFKFVAREPSDLDEAAELLSQLSPFVEPSRVFVMAEGTDAKTVLERSRTLVEPTTARGWGLTPRWHVLLWGNERGR